MKWKKERKWQICLELRRLFQDTTYRLRSWQCAVGSLRAECRWVTGPWNKNKKINFGFHKGDIFTITNTIFASQERLRPIVISSSVLHIFHTLMFLNLFRPVDSIKHKIHKKIKGSIQFHLHLNKFHLNHFCIPKSEALTLVLLKDILWVSIQIPTIRRRRCLQVAC